MKSLQVITLGCSKNTVDTERLLSCLDGVYQILPESHSGRVILSLLTRLSEDVRDRPPAGSGLIPRLMPISRYQKAATGAAPIAPFL